MKKVIPLVLALPLMACATSNTSSIIAQIQNATIQACGYFPAASSIATLVSTLVGGGAIVGQVEVIAQQICAAVVAANPPSPALKTPRLRAAKQVSVVINGVTITGHFVR